MFYVLGYTIQQSTWIVKVQRIFKIMIWAICQIKTIQLIILSTISAWSMHTFIKHFLKYSNFIPLWQNALQDFYWTTKEGAWICMQVIHSYMHIYGITIYIVSLTIIDICSRTPLYITQCSRYCCIYVIFHNLFHTIGKKKNSYQWYRSRCLCFYGFLLDIFYTVDNNRGRYQKQWI